MRVISGEHAPIKAWTDGVPVEEQSLAQLRNVASLPFIFRHVAVMPDVHLGIGATVGSVIPTSGAIVPAAVGVDIGCGMAAVCTTLRAADLPDNLGPLRSTIESVVPVGNGPGGSHRLDDMLELDQSAPLVESFRRDVAPYGFDEAKIPTQLGTLGGGNHFIEVCLDEYDRVWVMLHSGSRGLGNKIGQHFIALAKKDMEKFFIRLPDADLAYFPEGTEHFDAYVAAVAWAQQYALANREVMMRAILRALGWRVTSGPVVQCHHNYVAREHHFGSNVFVTRKGAVNASAGQLGLIPGSMGQYSYVVRGKGNPDSFNSCSHGAGRAMSRTEARRRFTVEDLAAQTAGVECRKDAAVVDEIPSAYKNLDHVMAAQAELIEIVHTLKAVLTVKG